MKPELGRVGALRRIPRGVRGIGLIEVMVSVLVLAVGLLGIAAMQSLALRGGQGSLESSQAVMQTGSILEAMRANPGVDYTMAKQCSVPTGTATLVAYDATPFAFTALRNGQVQAISQDGPKLIGLLANVPDRDKYEIPPFAISQDYIGVGIPKDEAALTDYVNTTLRELEASGQAQKIYDTWFGPKSKTPLQRIFKIGDKT